MPPAVPASASPQTRSSTASTPPLVEVRGLSKRFGAFWALRDASFSIRQGEILGLIGPNGSGKTTLFGALAGVMPATTGDVSAHGQLLPASRRKQKLFFVPDGVRPWPDQIVSWVLSFVGGLYDCPPAVRGGVAEQLGLEPLLSARMGSLSKGEHKRVLLAMGLLTPQPLLMLDEPFDGLDLRQTRDVMRVLREHVNTGRTLFLSIHQLGDAARICDRVVLLSAGAVMGAGTLEQLRAAARVRADAGLEEVFLALT